MAMQEVTAHGGSERYYYADGKKVPIVASRRFVAVRSADWAAEAATASKLKAALPGAAALGQVIELPEHNLMVVALEGEAQGSGLAATETMRNYVSAQPGMAPGPWCTSSSAPAVMTAWWRLAIQAGGRRGRPQASARAQQAGGEAGQLP